MNLLVAVFGLVAVSGVVSGFLGAGGQIICIPLLVYALPALAGRALDPHTVTSISLAQGLGALAGGIGHYQRRGLVDWRWAREEAPPLAAGGAAGALLSAALAGRALLLVFAVVTTAAAVVLLLPPREGAGPPGPGARVAAMAALAGSGALGGVVGIGAGALIIPVLIYVLGVPVRTAGGTGLALAVVLSVVALAGKAATGQVAWDLAAAGAVAGLAGAMIGSRLSGLAGPVLLRRLLAAVIALLAARVWFDLLPR